MRVDLFLKETRIIKRRVIAKEYCERGLVLLNERVCKPGAEVKEGDKLTIKFGERVFHIVAHVEPGKKKETVSYESLWFG